jgi:ribosomal protein L40E
MPRATCRCGQTLALPTDPNQKVVCPQCGAKVRIRLKPPSSAPAFPNDGFLRFFCPCGRRLKVNAAAPPPSGKCPDCGRIVPVPATSSTSAHPPGHPESPTDELNALDRDALDRWSAAHAARNASLSSSNDREEVGLRVCPECGAPVPMGSPSCRKCGAAVAKR